jgi:hypothetical protein
MKKDRRTRRSEQTDEALELQLDACAERAGLDSMLLADRDGLLLATSQPAGDQSEEIAAVLPLLARGIDFSGNLLEAAGAVRHELAVTAFEALGTELFLCALGGSDREVLAEIERAKAGVTRILN